MQITRDALALGDLGEMLDLLVGKSQLLLRTMHVRPEMVTHPHQNDQQQHRSPKTQRQLQVVGIDPQQGQTDHDEEERAPHPGREGPRPHGKHHKPATAPFWLGTSAADIPNIATTA